MKTELLICCLAAAGLSGCMSTHQLLGESPVAVSTDMKKLQGKEVDLTLTNGSFHEDVIFSSFGDSVEFRSEGARVPKVVPRTAVASVSKSGSAFGPIAGCLGGLIVGAMVGSSAALEDHLSTERKDFGQQFGAALTAPLAAAAGGIVGMLVGGTVGLVIGSYLGSGDTYILDPGPDSGVLEERGERCIAFAVTASGDSIFRGVAGLIGTTPGKVTVLWNGKQITLDRPPAEVVRRGRNVHVIAPEKVWQ